RPHTSSLFPYTTLFRSAVSEAAWDHPSPCEGWVARDVVRHMAAWMPGYFLGERGIETPTVPSVDDDPVGAWETVRDAIQSALDRSEEHTSELQSPYDLV